MELQYYGANCVRLSTKKASIVVDDNLSELGLKSITKPDDITIKSNKAIPSYPSKFTADMPGEYEISGAIIKGLAARAHMDDEKEATSVIYTVTVDDIKVAIIGHIYPELDEQQLEEIGLVDVAIIPVGGNGYTLDGAGALKIIKQVEPKVIIPTHFADKGVKYEIPQQELSEALKVLGMEPTEMLAKYKPNPGGLTDTTHLILLERQ